MNNELINNGPTALSTIGTTVHQNGSKNMHIDKVETVQVNRMMILSPPTQRQTINTPMAPCDTNQEYYNLFVIGNEEFASGSFIVPKDCALTESIADEVKSEYASLSDKAIMEIKKMPAIFASKNHEQCQTDAEHCAHFGYIADIKKQENGIKVYYQIMFPISQQKLNENASNFAIKSASFFNELNRTHWTIKNINVVEELRNLKMIPFF